MKNNGFTLIELLAVIVLLSVLTLIVTISVGTTINNSKIKLSKIQIEKVEEAAKLYYLSEGVNEGKRCVNVNYLLENDYIKEGEIKNLKNNTEIEGSVKIIYKNKKYKYEYQDTQCLVSIAEVCNLVSDADNSNSITLGDKYQCKVKDDMEEGFEDGYYFFVLSYNDDDGKVIEDLSEAQTINLIMERNMYYDETNNVGSVATETNKGLIKWVSRVDYNDDTKYGISGDNKKDGKNNKGPVTAMKYLHNATKDWTNVPNMIMNYEDENIDYDTHQKGIAGYGSIVTAGTTTIITSKNGEETGRIENLKTRMPRYDEVHGTGKCLTSTESEEKYGNKFGSCPLWLFNYMNSCVECGTITGKVDISEIYGYWTLSSHYDEGSARLAEQVRYRGRVSNNGVALDSYGIRPVITLGL